MIYISKFICPNGDYCYRMGIDRVIRNHITWKFIGFAKIDPLKLKFKEYTSKAIYEAQKQQPTGKGTH